MSEPLYTLGLEYKQEDGSGIGSMIAPIKMRNSDTILTMVNL